MIPTYGSMKKLEAESDYEALKRMAEKPSPLLEKIFGKGTGGSYLGSGSGGAGIGMAEGEYIPVPKTTYISRAAEGIGNAAWAVLRQSYQGMGMTMQPDVMRDAMLYRFEYRGRWVEVAVSSSTIRDTGLLWPVARSVADSVSRELAKVGDYPEPEPEPAAPAPADELPDMTNPQLYGDYDPVAGF